MLETKKVKKSPKLSFLPACFVNIVFQNIKCFIKNSKNIYLRSWVRSAHKKPNHLCYIKNRVRKKKSEQGNLSKGIVIWFVRREGLEPIKKGSSYLLFSLTLFL